MNISICLVGYALCHGKHCDVLGFGVECLVREHVAQIGKSLFLKQLPGRKSDVKDAQWIAECLLKNLIQGSFVPDKTVQDMRKYNRRIFDLNEDMTYNTNKLDAALQRCGFRLSSYVSRVKGKSYQKRIKAIIDGVTDPEKLVKLINGRNLRKFGYNIIKDAVVGDFHQADICLLRQYAELIGIIERQIEECKNAFTAMCQEHFPKQFERPQSISGVNERAASAIIAETGAEMKPFEKAANFVGWCGLKPRNDINNNKVKSNRTTHGN